MSALHYPLTGVIADAAAALAGGAFCALLTFSVEPGSFSFYVAGPLAAIFLGYGGLTLLRARMRIVICDAGVRCEPGGRSIRWDTLSGLELAYFSTRRDREDGWLQLTMVADDGGRLRVDSRITNFELLVAHAARAAEARAIPLDPATIHNLSAVTLPRG
ncbi:MAG: hypothetical protein AAF458_15830 [Pseudomonadota bacterium]